VSVSRRSMTHSPDIPDTRRVFGAGSCPGQEYQWLMRKNCSFSPRQVMLFYLSLTSVSFLFALIFALQGLWVILPFAIVENLMLAGALLYYARHALDRECVALARDELHVYVVDGSRVIHHCFNARWVRLEWRGRLGDALWLCQGDREIPLGRYLIPERRRAFARELRLALAHGR
jgi:uncharacterized membrane protein